MKLYTKQDLIDLVESLKNYTHESHSILGHDEREAKEFVDIFLKDRNPIELPSDSLCINCDESKSTHNVCMDCMIKIGKENIELPSDEEIDQSTPISTKNDYEIGFMYGFEEGAKWMRDKIQGGNK